MQTPGKKINRDITFPVDSVSSRLYSERVPDTSEILALMRIRLLHECKSIVASRERIKADIEAYHRVIDEMAQVSRREERTAGIIGAMGTENFALLYDTDQEFSSAIGAATTVSPKQCRDNLSLWEAMKEYLQYVPEARIAETEAFFEAVQMPNANRQSMESALKRHPETFKIRKDNREKYISLKSRAKEGG